MNQATPRYPNTGYEVIQGSGKVTGELLGGCIDVFPELLGTSLWPTLDQWKGKILLIETSEVDMHEMVLSWFCGICMPKAYCMPSTELLLASLLWKKSWRSIRMYTSRLLDLRQICQTSQSCTMLMWDMRILLVFFRWVCDTKLIAITKCSLCWKVQQRNKFQFVELI